VLLGVSVLYCWYWVLVSVANKITYWVMVSLLGIIPTIKYTVACDEMCICEDDPKRPCSFGGTKNTKLFWSHGVRLLEQLNAQRNYETFCDVVVHVGDGGSFSAHRCILAASSAKLYTLMFATTSNDCSRNVHLDAVSVSGFRIVLEFIYTGILSFDSDTIADVISAATYLEMPAVIRLCEEFTNSRRAMGDNDIKVEGSNSPQFSLATVAASGRHTRSSDGRLDPSLMAFPWSSSRFLPSGDLAEDYLSLFDTSCDQYYSTYKERGILPVCVY